MVLNSLITGSGPKQVIILHGLYGNCESWLQTAKMLPPDYTIHILDQRNHGKSFHHASHTYYDLAEDIKEYCDFYSLKQIYLIGHSMGGKAAMFFSKKYPEMVIKLVIADISPRNYTSLLEKGEIANFHLNLISIFQNINPSQFSSFKQVGDQITGLDENIKNIILKNLKKEDGKMSWKLNPEAIFNNLPEIMAGLNPDDFIDHKISAQTLFLKAENSNYIDSNDIKMINFIFDNVRIETIKNAGHWLHFEQPATVAAVITDFIDAK